MASLRLLPETFARADTLNPNFNSPAQLPHELIGPLFIAFIISSALFGLTCAQTGLYFRRYSGDSTRLKSIVITLLFLESCNITLVIYGIFVYTIIDRGDISCLNGILWSMLFQVVPANLVVTLVQYVWIIRIWTLSRSPRRTQITAAMLSSVLIEAVISIAWVVAAHTSTHWGQVQAVKWASVASFILRTFNDVVLTTLLCYHLQRSKNGLQETDNMIQKMMGYGLRAGGLNCMGSIALMVLVITLPTKPYYVGVHVISARIYANSLLAMLNWRHQKKLEPKVLDAAELSSEAAMELSTTHWGFTMASQLTIPDFDNM